MPTTESRKILNPYFHLCLTLLVLSGCGLGMDTQDRLERGQQAFLDEKYRAAIIDAKNVLQEEPQNVSGRLLLGRASIAVGDAVSAEIELRRAVELGAEFADIAVDLGRALLLQQKFGDVIVEIDPTMFENNIDRLVVLGIRGDAYLGIQQPSEARETYSTLLREDSGNREALLGVVRSYVAERNLIQARQSLDQVLDIDATYAPAWMTSGLLNVQMGDLGRAEGDFAKAAELANEVQDIPTEMVSLFGLADTQLNQGRNEEVRPTLVRMNEISAEDSRTLMVAARLAAAERSWADAQRNLQEILIRTPDNRSAQMLLGAVHKESGNLEQAEMYLSAVVTDLPENVAARRLLADIRYELNKIDEAQQALAPLITGDDVDVRSLSMSAAISLQSGDIQNAAELLERGIVTNPGETGLQLQLAYTQFRAGDASEAQRTLQGISAATSEQTEYQRDSLLVLTQIAQGETENGLRNSRAIVSRWPDLAAAHSLLGFVLAIADERKEARASFERAEKLASGDDTGPLWFLAQLDEVEDDLESADRRYREVLERQPKESRAMVALARSAAQREDYDEAKTWLEKAIDVDEFAVAPQKALASLLLALREYSAVEQVIEKLLNISNNDAESHNMLGLAKLNQNNLGEAEESFERALELDRDSPVYRLNLSRAQAGQGNNLAAIATIDEMGDESLRHVPTGIMLASLKANAGDKDEASRIAARLVAMHPDVAAPRALQAELLASREKYIEASAAYDDVRRIENSRIYAARAYRIRGLAKIPNQVEPLVAYLQERPLDDEFRLYLAQAYQVHGQLDEASKHYEQVLNSVPNNFVAANNLAWNYFQSNDPRAEELARKAFELQPENESVVDTLGWILISKGEYQDGTKLLRDAVELGDGRAEIRFHLAAALARSGEPQEAKRILQEIVSGRDQFGSRQEAEELLSTL